MNDIAFKTFGIFCFSVMCFGVGTAIAGKILASDDDASVFFVAWLIGSITFGIAMAIEHG